MLNKSALNEIEKLEKNISNKEGDYYTGKIHAYNEIKEIISNIDEIKILDLVRINILNKKTILLLNYNIDNNFYDNFMFNNIKWLDENREKIEDDFNKNIEIMRFSIIDSDLDERVELINDLVNKDICEFNNYINIMPYNELSNKDKEIIEIKFNTFKTFDSYDRINYFDNIRRK